MIQRVSFEDICKNSQLIERENKEYPYILLYRQWRFFYSLNADTSPLDTTTLDGSQIPKYVALMLYKFETSKILLEESFGLRDPLKEGFFYKKGAKFIDIYIKNIPREHGIAAGMVYDEEIKELHGTKYDGESLRITIHKNLITKTATPLHELFHIYQYGYVHFNNMWFMEGLARWSQSIMQEKTGTLESLPKTLEELDILVHKLHDAEFFWNNLVTLCEDEKTFIIPNGLEENQEIYNNKKTGSKFMKLFLENCELEYESMKKEYKSRQLDDSSYIQRQEKRAVTNNIHIFKAILKTANELKKDKSKELSDFLDLIYPLANISFKSYDTKDIQAFMKVLKKYIPSLVLEKEGILYCEYFDIFTGSLSVPKLEFISSSLDDEELESFKVLKRLNGSLVFKKCKNISSLNGLRNLLSLDGELILEELDLKKISDLNNIESLKSLKIVNLSELKTINGFNELHTIKSDLIINKCRSLENINGFNSLKIILNITIGTTMLSSCKFLESVFEENQEFKGAVKITNSKLKDVKFFKGIKKINSSLFLHQNELENLKGLDKLEYVGASLSLSANKLVTLESLSSLKKINGLLAISYNNLTTLKGLENLTYIRTKKWGDDYFSLKFYGNKNLKDISALQNIQTPDNYMVIYFDKNQNYDNKPDSSSAFHKNILELRDYKTNSLVPTYKFVEKQSHDYSNFRAATHNKTLTMLFDFEVKSAEILVLSFTGAFGNLGGMFYNKYPIITENINTHKIFIMDPKHTWYNGGFGTFTKNMDENIKFIKELILSKKYKKVVTMGTSMGAYLSLVLGASLEGYIDEVLAFSPQTFLDKDTREKFEEKRWSSLVKAFPKNIPLEYLNLKYLFEKHKNKITKFSIHYGQKLKLDEIHVKNIPFQGNITLIPYDVDDHYITVMLHKQDKLNPILLESFK